MGCQASVVIGNNLTFSVCTHEPDTGVLTDADAAPDYRVYEDETAVAILTGSMASLDGVNTTGFYTEQIACSVANGFENGKSYTIYIEATVDGDTGGISYGFTAVTLGADVWSAVAESTLTYAEVVRIALAVLAGESTGGGTATPTMRDVADTKARVTYTVTTSGNRTAVVLDGA